MSSSNYSKEKWRLADVIRLHIRMSHWRTRDNCCCRQFIPLTNFQRDVTWALKRNKMIFSIFFTSSQLCWLSEWNAKWRGIWKFPNRFLFSKFSKIFRCLLIWFLSSSQVFSAIFKTRFKSRTTRAVCCRPCSSSATWSSHQSSATWATGSREKQLWRSASRSGARQHCLARSWITSDGSSPSEHSWASARRPTQPSRQPSCRICLFATCDRRCLRCSILPFPLDPVWGELRSKLTFELHFKVSQF